uniref:WUSCHEL homeobox protein n=1 Tax=Pinus pinaster TaxID=71647 RepID=A0A2I4KAN6_PINPS|nr:WUSCHEL homeobox protein [Pinus pinaster]
MNPNIAWPSMFKANPSRSQSQRGEASIPSAISCQRQSCEGISSESEERNQRESKPRWNPKPEQIRVLQSIFNSGVTNPTPKEIKRIRAQLQQFGEIRDASVFYWFQNKKARTKQRQRPLHSGETSKSGSEKTKTDHSKEIIKVSDTTANSLGNAGETYSSVVRAAQFSYHQGDYHLPMNGGISNDQCSYTSAEATTAAKGGIFNEGSGGGVDVRSLNNCSNK